MPQSTHPTRLTIKPNRAFIKPDTYDVQFVDNVLLSLNGEVIYSLSHNTYNMLQELGYVEIETI